FSADDPVVQRTLASELMAPGPIGEVVAGIRPGPLRFALLCKLVDVAWIDDELHPAERQRLEQVCAVFGLEPAWIEDLHGFLKAPPLAAPAGPLILRAAACMVAADGVESPAEGRRLQRLAAHLGLGPAEVEGAQARIAPLASVVAGLEPRGARLYLLRVLIELACVDGEVHPAERSALAGAAVALGLTEEQGSTLIALGFDLGRSDRALLS
ncbi:MAG: hypothetical protein R3F43_33065, partial [bacterium]